MNLVPAFWQQTCGARGPGLGHTHSQHIGNLRDYHAACPCRECGLTPERWAQLVQHELREAGIPPEGAHLVDLDSLPLESERIPVEPKMATGILPGPLFGPGRGWVTPMMHKRWEAIAYIAMRDDERHLRPMP